MSFKCGIVGLPNVGKSTIFNAITNTAKAQSANYPFCTIEPNIASVAVPDDRLNVLANIAGSQKIIPSYIDIVDIAGLVKGASKGEGLGNQFLSNIREVDAIIHIVRCFEDDDITHVENTVDPIRDIEIIESELMIADMMSLEKRQKNLEKKLKTNDKEAIAENEVITKLLDGLNKNKKAIEVVLKDDEKDILKTFQLLTDKKILYVANVDEKSGKETNQHLQNVINYANKINAKVLSICATLEAEMIDFSEEEKAAFLVESGFGQTALGKIIKEGYQMLELISFFTVGPKECHAWSIKKGYFAPQAAGKIHTDFEKGFIRAETISYKDYVELKGEAGAKEAGKLRVEGKEYIVEDGDVMHFRFNN